MMLQRRRRRRRRQHHNICRKLQHMKHETSRTLKLRSVDTFLCLRRNWWWWNFCRTSTSTFLLWGYWRTHTWNTNISVKRLSCQIVYGKNAACFIENLVFMNASPSSEHLLTSPTPLIKKPIPAEVKKIIKSFFFSHPNMSQSSFWFHPQRHSMKKPKLLFSVKT